MFKYVPKYDVSSIFQAKDVSFSPPIAWYTFIATWFYVGRIGIMPGTLGSLAVYPLYFFLISHATGYESAYLMFWGTFLLLFVIGWMAVHSFERDTYTHDHKMVVIDEVLGMLLIFSLGFKECFELGSKIADYFNFALEPYQMTFVCAFVVFRYFDIRKPFFIGYIDKFMKSSLSVILDDLAAGLFSYFTIVILNSLAQKFL